MRLRIFCNVPALIVAVGIGFAVPFASHAQSSVDEAPFLAENAAAMDKMMADMSVKPTGDVDADFSAMMIPHHQGAVEMAEIQLRFGRDERLRRLAQGIIVEQRQEIAVMQRILDEKPAAPGQAAGAPTRAHGHHDHKDMKP